MKFKKEIIVKVNGKIARAVVTVEATELDEKVDGVTAQMMMTAVANNQDMLYRSRNSASQDCSILVLDHSQAGSELSDGKPPYVLPFVRIAA